MTKQWYSFVHFYGMDSRHLCNMALKQLVVFKSLSASIPAASAIILAF